MVEVLGARVKSTRIPEADASHMPLHSSRGNARICDADIGRKRAQRGAKVRALASHELLEAFGYVTVGLALIEVATRIAVALVNLPEVTP